MTKPYSTHILPLIGRFNAGKNKNGMKSKQEECMNGEAKPMSQIHFLSEKKRNENAYINKEKAIVWRTTCTAWPKKNGKKSIKHTANINSLCLSLIFFSTIKNEPSKSPKEIMLSIKTNNFSLSIKSMFRP